MKSENEKYCQECGAAINAKAEICPKCGVRQPPLSQPKVEVDPEEKARQDKWLITLILCFLVGPLGVHRFYTGNIVIGVLQLITLGGCGIWVLVDLILLVVGSYKDGDGNVLKGSF